MRVVLDREGGCLFEREAQPRRGHITEGSLFKKGGGGITDREVIREGDLLDISRVALIIMMIIMK